MISPRDLRNVNGKGEKISSDGIPVCQKRRDFSCLRTHWTKSLAQLGKPLPIQAKLTANGIPTSSLLRFSIPETILLATSEDSSEGRNSFVRGEKVTFEKSGVWR